MVYIEFTKGDYKNASAIYYVINYILDPHKNPHKITNCENAGKEDIKNISKCFEKTQKIWRKENGKRIRHFHVDFPTDCLLTYKDYNKIAFAIMEYFEEYQIIFALHEYNNDYTPCHKHLHFALNPINYCNGNRIRIGKKKMHDIRFYINKVVLAEYNIIAELSD